MSNPSHPIRVFGRFELRRLLGKSAATMTWHAFDPKRQVEVMLSLPRLQPADTAAVQNWNRKVQLAARLRHPNLARVSEIGLQDHWPFTVAERALGITLDEHLAVGEAPAVVEVVTWVRDALLGLACAHEAGMVHGDLQTHYLLIDERGQIRLMALAVAGEPAAPPTSAKAAANNERTMAVDPAALRAHRSAATRDVLAGGLLLYRLLTGQPALDQADTGLVIARMSPIGREFVRLPWSTPHPIPDALRAIVNRAISAQERLRYQSVRTLIGALTGWLEAAAQDGTGPVERLIERLHSVGHLPALPGLTARVARVIGLESQRTDVIAAQVLDDMALSFELLRTLNTAQVQGTQVSGNGPVLTLRRIIALIGVDGVRRAANTLRVWPGPLQPEQATALRRTLDRVRLAGHTAQALRPRGYDAQVVYLVTALQNLGRLMLCYHFADEAAQIDRLMRPGRDEGGASRQPGLTEQTATFAVIGVDIESLGHAVARHWGLGDDVMHMARRLPPEAVVRRPTTDDDDEILRLTASAANDAIDAVDLADGPPTAALDKVAQRYARALGLTVRDFAAALQSARDAMREGIPAPPERRDQRPGGDPHGSVAAAKAA